MCFEKFKLGYRKKFTSTSFACFLNFKLNFIKLKIHWIWTLKIKISFFVLIHLNMFLLTPSKLLCKVYSKNNKLKVHPK
jgi:hypothetical protein